VFGFCRIFEFVLVGFWWYCVTCNSVALYWLSFMRLWWVVVFLCCFCLTCFRCVGFRFGSFVCVGGCGLFGVVD